MLLKTILYLTFITTLLMNSILFSTDNNDDQDSKLSKPNSTIGIYRAEIEKIYSLIEEINKNSSNNQYKIFCYKMINKENRDKFFYLLGSHHNLPVSILPDKILELVKESHAYHKEANFQKFSLDDSRLFDNKSPEDTIFNYKFKSGTWNIKQSMNEAFFEKYKIEEMIKGSLSKDVLEKVLSQNLKSLKPGFYAYILSNFTQSLYTVNNVDTSEASMDKALFKLAQDNHKIVKGLESEFDVLKGQFYNMTSRSVEQNFENIWKSYSEIENSGLSDSEKEELIKVRQDYIVSESNLLELIYRSGDSSLLESHFPHIIENHADGRNNGLANKILDIINTSNSPGYPFFTVGVAHLLGKYGLLERLKSNWFIKNIAFKDDKI